MSVFVDYSVQPTYGQKKAVVRWTLSESFQGADVYVFKSYTGVQPWTLLNTQSPVNGSEYLDTNVVIGKDTHVPFYKLLVDSGGVQYPSEVFRPFDKLTRMEYGACQTIIKRIYTQLSRADGLPMFILKPRKLKESGLSNVDPETGQVTGPVCEDLADYGKLYDPAVQTWVKLTPANNTVKEAGTEAGLEESTMRQGTILCFPYPQHGDLIVHPALDDRYAVVKADPITFRGLVPVLFNLALTLLSRDDVRYKVPVPVYQRELP